MKPNIKIKISQTDAAVLFANINDIFIVKQFTIKNYPFTNAEQVHELIINEQYRSIAQLLLNRIALSPPVTNKKLIIKLTASQGAALLLLRYDDILITNIQAQIHQQIINQYNQSWETKTTSVAMQTTCTAKALGN